MQSFNTKTDVQFKRITSLKVNFFIFIIFSSINLLSLYSSFDLFIFIESLIFFGTIFTFIKQYIEAEVSLTFEENILYIKYKHKNKSYKFYDISQYDFVLSQSRAEKIHNYTSMTIKGTTFTCNGIMQYDKMKKYIENNF